MTQISPQFKRALESEIRRLMESSSRISEARKVKAVVVKGPAKSAAAFELLRFMKSLGKNAVKSGTTISFPLLSVDKATVDKATRRIQRQLGFDAQFVLQFGQSRKALPIR